MVEMISVSSSNIKAIGFDDKILIVQFNDGSLYHYYNVNKSLFDGMLLASSKGKYLNENIKKQGYSYKKVL